MARATSPRIDPPTILLVDDEEDLRQGLAEYLLAHGCAVRIAGNGAELRAQLDRERADVVVLDIAMPGEDGLTLARWLARTHPGIGVIMSTASAASDTRIFGIEAGADDYLTKPYNPRELLARVRRLVERLPAPGAPTPAPAPRAADTGGIAIGDVLFDPGARRLTGPGRPPLPLTGHQAELLHALATRPNRVLSRSFLGELLPGGNGDASRQIDILVTRLRARLREAGVTESPIETVRGEGYVFKA